MKAAMKRNPKSFHNLMKPIPGGQNDEDTTTHDDFDHFGNSAL